MGGDFGNRVIPGVFISKFLSRFDSMEESRSFNQNYSTDNETLFNLIFSLWKTWKEYIRCDVTT